MHAIALGSGKLPEKLSKNNRGRPAYLYSATQIGPQRVLLGRALLALMLPVCFSP
jgi:hypothetical protein